MEAKSRYKRTQSWAKAYLFRKNHSQVYRHSSEQFSDSRWYPVLGDEGSAPRSNGVDSTCNVVHRSDGELHYDNLATKQRLRAPLTIHFGGQANLFDSGRRQAKAALASTKADLPSLPKCKNLLLPNLIQMTKTVTKTEIKYPQVYQRCTISLLPVLYLATPFFYKSSQNSHLEKRTVDPKVAGSSPFGLAS